MPTIAGHSLPMAPLATQNQSWNFYLKKSPCQRTPVNWVPDRLKIDFGCLFGCVLKIAFGPPKWQRTTPARVPTQKATSPVGFRLHQPVTNLRIYVNSCWKRAQKRSDVSNHRKGRQPEGGFLKVLPWMASLVTVATENNGTCQEGHLAGFL